MGKIKERMAVVKSCDQFEYVSCPGDGTARYVFQGYVAVGLKTAWLYATAYNRAVRLGWSYASEPRTMPSAEAFNRIQKRAMGLLGRTDAVRQGCAHGWIEGGARFHLGQSVDGTER